MNVTAKKREIGLLAKGFHVGTIESIILTEIESAACKAGDYTDATPQLEITLKTEKGSTKHWLFLKGYEKFDEFTKNMSPKERAKYRPAGDKNYAVSVVTGQRIESEEETAKCMDILGNFASSAGVEDGQEVDVLSLAGSEIGFFIGEGNNGGNRVKYTCEAAYAKSQIDKVEEAPIEA